ncbi:MAG: hypothetical protein LC644_05305, partial [Pseudonocardia sp.]|nr:hypothetical protein [Pseudonocardia sp.]
MQAADRATSAPPAEELHRLLAGEHHDPHAILGAHPHADGTAVRVLRPEADEVTVLTDDDEYPLEHLAGGFFHGMTHGSG